jgi:hypothetical protein
MAQSMSAIKTKLGSSSNSLRAYSAARGLTAPDSMLEFDTWLNGPAPPPPPPPTVYYSFLAVHSTTSAADACDTFGKFLITVYSTCQTLDTNCTLRTYFDAEPERLRTVLSGWYSIGGNWYYVNNNSGIINSKGTCASLTNGCECYRVYNEGGRDDGAITFQYNRCSDGNLDSLTVGPGSSRTVCVQNGTEIDSDSGLMTVVPCPDPCSTNGDCEECA